jgi:hypothetical protein
MNQTDRDYRETRDIWNDYNRRQEFEHDLINRKTTWLLTTQTILFAAYGLTFRIGSVDEVRDQFRDIVASSGLAIALIILVGMLALIRSKVLSWRAYKDFYDEEETPNPPRPLDRGPLEWGVHSRTTPLTLLPDVLLPLVFVMAWCLLLL